MPVIYLSINYRKTNDITKTKATSQAIRYVFALSFPIANAHTTKISETPSMAAAI